MDICTGIIYGNNMYGGVKTFHFQFFWEVDHTENIS